MVEQPVRFSLIAAHLTHDGVPEQGIPARSVMVLASGVELKVKITETALKHGNSRYAMGFLPGDVDVTGSLVTPLDTDELDQMVQDSLAGAVITLVGIGKMNENGVPKNVVRVIGVKFTEYDTKHEGKKTTNPAASFNALTWTKVMTQVITA